MAKRFLYDAEARTALRRGLDALGDALRVTLGPRGRHVVLQRSGGLPALTSDGVTIAGHVELSDPFENLGVRLGREVTMRTQEAVGDGTTTAAVLTQAIVHEGLRGVEAGANAMAVKRGLDRALARVLEEIARLSRPVQGVDELSRVAAAAARNDPQLGRLVGEALVQAGPDAVVVVEKGQGTETRVETSPGYRFPGGYLSPYFVTDPERMDVELNDCRLLACEGNPGEIAALAGLLERAATEAKSFLLVVGELGENALATLVVNRLRGTLPVVAVQAPGFGEERRRILDDIAAVTGATVVSRERGLEAGDVRWEDLGTAERVIVTGEETILLGGGGSPEKLAARSAQLRRFLEEEDDAARRRDLAARLAQVSGGMRRLQVGAVTEVEAEETRTRAEDAVAAARAVMQEGVVPGGGAALLWTARFVHEPPSVGDERIGVRALERALSAPLWQISQNAGCDGPEIVEQVRQAGSPSSGFNAETLRVEDLAESGVMDPTRVVRAGLLHAVSIAGLILTTETLLAEVEEEGGADEGPETDR